MGSALVVPSTTRMSSPPPRATLTSPLTPSTFTEFYKLMTDLMVLPRLRAALIAMLEELPDGRTGLGASEMDLLDFVNDGHTEPKRICEARWLRFLSHI